MADSTSDAQTVQAFNDVAAVLIPLKANVRGRVHAAVGAALGLGDLPADPLPAKAAKAPKARPAAPAPRSAPKPAAAKVPQAAAPSGAPSPKDFWADKKPTTDVERVACLGYYLSQHRGTKRFKAGDIRDLSAEVGYKFSNTMTSVNNTTRAGLLSAMSRGIKQLSATGRRYVEKLPDRAAARDATRKPKAKAKS